MAKKKTTSWKELKSIADRNALRLEQEPENFIENDVKKYQEEVAKEVEFLLSMLETSNGDVKKNKNNLIIIGKLDGIMNQLALTSGSILVNSLLKRISDVLKMNVNYYGAMLSKDETLKSVKESIEKEVNQRFGIKEDGTLIVGGFISSLLLDQSVKNTLKQNLYTSIYANSKVTSVMAEAKAYLSGKKGVKGAIESFYSKYTNEAFNHADRMSSREFAKKYGLKWFIYAGTLVDNSRAFCKAKIGGIYNTLEAEKWIDETPSPLGISKESYSPTIHMGGINCRHSPFFITERMKNEYEKSLKS